MLAVPTRHRRSTEPQMPRLLGAYPPIRAHASWAPFPRSQSERKPLDQAAGVRWRQKLRPVPPSAQALMVPRARNLGASNATGAWCLPRGLAVPSPTCAPGMRDKHSPGQTCLPQFHGS